MSAHNSWGTPFASFYNPERALTRYRQLKARKEYFLNQRTYLSNARSVLASQLKIALNALETERRQAFFERQRAKKRNSSTSSQTSVEEWHTKWIHVDDADGNWLATFEYDDNNPEERDLAVFLAQRVSAGVTAKQLGRIMHQAIGNGAEIGVRVALSAVDDICSLAEFAHDPSLGSALGVLPFVPGTFRTISKKLPGSKKAGRLKAPKTTGKGLLNRIQELELPFKKENFRKNLSTLWALGKKGPAGYDAHHVFPQALETRFRKSGINIHDPAFGAWWEQSAHQAASKGYQREWERFLSKSRTQDEIIGFGKKLSERFGFDWQY